MQTPVTELDDATHLQNWQISQAAERNMPTPRDWQERLGFEHQKRPQREAVTPC